MPVNPKVRGEVLSIKELVMLWHRTQYEQYDQVLVGSG